MISRIFIIFLITATVKCLNYDSVPRLVKNKTVDYRVSLRQILRLPEVHRPPFNLFKSREEFVKLAEQNIQNYKPYNYKLYRPYNPSKPAFIYDRGYVTKVLSSLGLLRPLENVPSNPPNTTESVITTGTENLNIKVNSSTESPKPVNNSFVTSESNERETTTTANSNEDINTTTNRYTEQTTDAAVSITKDAERTTQLTTESFGSSTYTTEGTNILNYSTAESTTESNGIESTTDANTEETIYTTKNSYTEQTTDAAVSITENAESTTELTTKSFEFSKYTTEVTNIPNYSTTESVTESNRVESITNSNTEETILTTTNSYTTLTPNTEDSSTVDEQTIAQFSTDSFGIASTTDILSYSSTEPATNAGTQYTTEISTTERLESEKENFLLSGSNVETTTTSNTQDGFNPTTPDVSAFITQFGHVPTSTAEDAERTTELTTESFIFSTYTTEGTNILNYSTTESVTESIRINQTTRDANTEETIFDTTDSYTTLTSNAEVSLTIDEGTIVQSFTDSFGIANTTDILSYSSKEQATNAEIQYSTEFSTIERIDPENENLLLTGSNRVETTTTSNTQDGFYLTTPDVTAFITQFGYVITSIAEDAEKTTKLTTESFGFSTYTPQKTNIPNYSTTETVTESNRIDSTADANTEETIYATTDSYTILAPKGEDSSTGNEETITQFLTTSSGIATITDIPSFSSTEPATHSETQYTTEISTTDSIEPENENLLFTDANRIVTTTTSITEEDVDPTSTGATASITHFGNSEDVEGTTALTTESFGFPTNAADVTNISIYSPSELVTESNRINQTTTHAYTEETIFTTTDTYTTLTPNAEAFLTVDEETIAQSSTESVGVATTADILSYSSTETATSAETVYATEISTADCMELENDNLMFINLNHIETTTTSNTEENYSSTEQSVDSYMTLPPYLTEESITELSMESWDIEMTTKTDILKYSTSTVNPYDTTIESLTTETNQTEEQTNANPTKTAYETENYTTSGVVDVESTTLELDIEATSQVCDETIETENFSETLGQSETVTTEKFENITSKTEATEISIDVTMELNEKNFINILNGNTTEQEPIVFSTTDNFNLEDSIGTTAQISKEKESLADLLQPATDSSNEVSTQTFDYVNVKDIKESKTNVVRELWNTSTTPLLEDITTEMYEVSSTSALMDNSFTQSASISTITELPTLSTTEGNDKITTEISQIECSEEMIEQVEETTIEAEATGETFKKSATELMLTEISGMGTATDQILKNITENDKRKATSRVLLTDDTTASKTVDNILETYNEIVPEIIEQSTNQYIATLIQASTTEVMDENSTEFYKENTTKQIEATTPISLDENPTTTSSIVTTNRLINIKSNTLDNKSNEETSVTPSNHLENMQNTSIEPLYNRQQKLAIKNLSKESSKRKAKKFNYDTDVMPSLGDYDYI